MTAIRRNTALPARQPAFNPRTVAMTSKTRIRTAIWALLGGWAALAAGGLPAQTGTPKPQPVSAQAAEFFESRVRPVLAENCFRCHGPKRQRANLRLDSAAGVLKGGESGPAVVP